MASRTLLTSNLTGPPYVRVATAAIMPSAVANQASRRRRGSGRCGCSACHGGDPPRVGTQRKVTSASGCRCPDGGPSPRRLRDPVDTRSRGKLRSRRAHDRVRPPSQPSGRHGVATDRRRAGQPWPTLCAYAVTAWRRCLRSVRDTALATAASPTPAGMRTTCGHRLTGRALTAVARAAGCTDSDGHARHERAPTPASRSPTRPPAAPARPPPLGTTSFKITMTSGPGFKLTGADGRRRTATAPPR